MYRLESPALGAAPHPAPRRAPPTTLAPRKPIDGAFRTWSDGQRVHLLIQFSGGSLGRNPVTMHATTELVPARAAVRRHLVSGDEALAGDPVAVEALATRVGAFSAFRRIGRAAKGAVSLATAPVRALGGAGVNVLKTTTNLAKGVESTTALAEYATRPLAWRPRKKGGGSGGPATRAPEAAPAPGDEDSSATDQEEPMSDETSGNPRPEARHVMGALSLLHRARHNPKAARHVQNIAKAAAAGHPGAMLAHAAIAEARKQQRQQPASMPAPMPPPMPTHVRSAAFPAWARGAA